MLRIGLAILKMPAWIIVMMALIVFLFGGQIVTIVLKALLYGIKTLLRVIFHTK